MKKFHTFKPQSFELLTGLRGFFAVTLMVIMALGNVKAEEITYTFSSASGTINDQLSFTTAKNNGNTTPAMYSELRLYFANNGKGNSCTIHVIDGYVITGLQFTSIAPRYTPNCDYTCDGEATAHSVPLTSQNYSITGVYATDSLRFQNVGSSQLRIESITITYKQICNVPTNLSVSNIGNTTALLKWEKGGTETNWKINLNGTISDATGAFTSEDSVFYNLTGLDIHADYAVSVAAACAIDNVSLWSDTVDFTTTCPDYSTYLPDVSICEGNSYTFYDQTLTTAGEYHKLLNSSTNCDSIVVLTLSVNPVYSHTDHVTICENELPYTYVDTVFAEGTVSDIYTIHFVSAQGCDSLVDLEFIVNPTPESDDAVTICDSDFPYFYAGSEFPVGTTSGRYDVPLTSSLGCDSTVHLTLTVNPTYAGVDTIYFCQGAVPITYGDSTFYGAGDKNVHFTSALGCDSLIALTIIENPTYLIDEYDTICASVLPYSYHNVYNIPVGATSGDYTIPLRTAADCDSIIVLHLTVNPIYNIDVTRTICSGDLPQNICGRNFDENATTGQYVIPFRTVNGCDSIINLDLTVNPSYEEDTNITVCASVMPITFGDSTLAAAGTHDVHFTLETGCDSLVRVHLTVNPTFHTYDAVSICELPYTYKNTKVFPVGTVTGVYDVDFETVAECDSIVSLTLTVNQNYHTYDTVTICNNILPYNYHGYTFTGAGDYNVHFTSVTDCDSLVSLHLNVNPTYHHTDEITICDNLLPYTYAHETFTSAGVYDVHFATAEGCDSLITVTLNVNPVYSHTDEVTVCADLLPYTYAHETFTAAGVYDVHFTTAAGCDSLVEVTFNVNPIYVGVDTTRICINDLPYYYPNSEYEFPIGTVTGTYPLHLATTDGCDSLIHLYLEVNPIYNHTDAVTICDSELPFNYNGLQTFPVGTNSGTIEFNLQSAAHCDSTVVLTLTVNPTYFVPVSAEICQGETYTIHAGTEFERNLTATGIYTDTLKTIHNCDSVVELTLTVHELPNVQIISEGNVCLNEFITLTATGIDMYDAIQEENFVGMAGANNSEYGALASIRNNTLTTYPTTSKVYPAGGAIRLGTATQVGTMTSTSLDLSEPFTVVMGVKGWKNKDGIIRATVGSQTQTITAPQFASWEIGGFTEIATNFNAATNNSTITFATVAGNSAAYIDYIYVIPTNALRYSWNTGAVTSQISVSPDVDTEYTVVGTDEHGCVNTASTTIIVDPAYTHTVDVAVCDNEVPYYHNGRLTGSVSGAYTLNYLLPTGCDSIVTVNLTVNPTPEIDINEEICDGETYHIGDSAYTTSGHYDVHFTTVAGCDSLVHLNLIVNPTYHHTDVVTICAYLLPYRYGSETFTAAGVYDVHFATAAGCDSLVTVTFNVNPVYTHTDAVTICDSELPYVYGTSTFPVGTQTGVYPVTFVLPTGCDSIVNLTLTVNQTYDLNENVAACDNELPYVYNADNSFDAAGVYDILFTTVNGCDSLVHVTFTVNPTYHHTDDVTICADLLPYSYGPETFTAAGIYDVHFTTAAGCDSLVTVTLNVNPVYTHTDAVVICENELPYTYGDTIFPVGTVTGVYPIIFALPTGCDSIVNLTLTVNDLNACSFVIDAVANANGTITPAGGQTIAHGADAAFTITPNACYYISEVLVDGTPITITDPTTMTYTFDSVYANHNITASFAIYQYNMTSNAYGHGNITNDVADCGSSYDYVINADHGYHLDSIYLDGVMVEQFMDETTNNYIYSLSNIAADHSVEAYFAINHYTVNTTVDGLGTVSVLGDSVVIFDESITYVITPEPCQELVDVTVDGVSMMSEVVGNTFTYANIDLNAVVIFTFDTIEYEMNAQLLGNGFGNVTTGLAQCGQGYSFVITADEGSYISAVRLGGIATTMTDETTFEYELPLRNASRDTTIYVTFVLTHNNVTASVVGGNGTITPTDTIVNYGTPATLNVSADAANGYAIETITCGDSVLTFDDNTTTYSYQVQSVTSDTSVVATFALRQYAIDVTAGANGTVTPDDTIITYGDNVQYTITADPCYYINTITVDGLPVVVTDPTLMTYTFNNVAAPHAIDAQFAIYKYDMTSTAGANGSVTSALQVDCGSDYTYTVTADAGYHIASVTLDGVDQPAFVNQEATATYPIADIHANHNLDATFAINGYTVTATAGSNGTITPAGDSVVEHGNSINFTVAPDACYHLTDLTVNGTSVLDAMVGNDYTLTNVTAPADVAATFGINVYDMTATYDNTLGIVNEGQANCSDTYTYVVTANEGYHIESLEIGGVVTPYGNNSDVTVNKVVSPVLSDTNLIVNFAINTYHVTTNITTGQGNFTPDNLFVNHGDDATITIASDSMNGYHIMTVTCGADVVTYGNNTNNLAVYTITNITSDTVLSAAFGLDGHLVTVINNGNGTVAPTTQTLVHGNDVTFTLTPDDCYYIGEVLVDGVDAMGDIVGDSTGATYLFDSVIVPHTLEVTFNMYQYAMTSDAYGHGTVNSAVVNCGSDFQYMVQAEEGYHIHTIFVDYVSDTLFQNQEDSYIYSMQNIRANHHLIADFDINQYVVTAVAGVNGIISPIGDSIVNHGDAITYTVTPDPCYHVADLTVNGVSVLADMVGNDYTLTAIAATTTIEATFAINEYAMNASVTGIGTVSDSVINCGTDYTYTIEAGEGYHIQSVEIGGNITTYGNNDDVTATFTVTNAYQDTTLNVVFGINTYHVTTLVTNGQGEFTPTDTIVNHGDNATFTINADAANGYHIADITCGADVVTYGNNADITATYIVLNVVSDTLVSANFELNNYTITATNGANGTINPVGDTALIYGDVVTYTITPDACYYIDEILVDGVAIVIDDTTGTTYTFNAVDDNHTIEANFAIYQYNMASVANGNGTVTDAVVNCGDDYTYTITADEGYHIVDVYFDGALDTVFANQEAAYTFTETNITAHHNLTVNFGINHYTITATAGTNGTINPIGDSVATHGQDLVYTITPDHCYFIQEVLVDGVSAMNDLVGNVDGATYTFTAIDAPHTIDVSFEMYQYAMNAAITGIGTVSEAIVNCGSDYTYNVQAGVGYHIQTIQIGDSIATFGNNTDVTTTFDIINALQDTTLNVVFAINTYHVTTLVASSQGTFTPADMVVDHGQNAIFTVDADAANGYHIVDITCGADVVTYGDNADITATYTVFNVVSDTMVSANFALNTYNIVATEGLNGHITPLGTSVVTHGDAITYTITPDAPCYYINEILIDGAAIVIDDTTGTTYTFNNVIEHHTIDVAFEIYEYNMTSTAYGNGTVSSAVVNCGTDYDYQINADYGYHIDSVYVDGVLAAVFTNQEANDVRSFTNILTHHHVDAYFSINHYDIVSTAGANGNISPVGATTYTHGDDAVYTITPDACYYISEILIDGVPTTIDDITGTTYTFNNIVAPHTIDASFAIYQYNMSYTQNAGGSVAPAAVPTVVNCGTDYTYTVTANTGYHIESLTLAGVTTVYGDNDDVVATVTINDVSRDTVLDVVFAINTYNIDVTTVGHGTTTPGDTVVDYGTTITYNINAEHGYHIVDVLVDGVSVGAFGNRDDSTFVYTFTNVIDDHTLDVNFGINQYTITATAGANGTIMMPGVTTVNYNEDVPYTISSNIGYHINTITVDGVLDTTFTNNENLYVYTFENVDADHTIAVDFAINTYDVTVTATGNGTITPGDTTLNYGDDITYIFTPNTGSEVVSVIVNGEDMGAFDSYDITDIAHDYDIEVVFGDITYRLMAYSYGNGTITPADTTVGFQGTAIYNLTPASDCYEISEILVNGVSYLNNAAFDANANTLTLAAIEADMTIQAYYQIKNYTVTATATEGATITETGVYNCGSDVVYNITVDDCYNMDSVVVDGIVVPNTNTIVFNDIDANHTINAYFSIKTFTVTSSVNDPAFGTITATDTFDCGETPTYTITPATGYHIDSVLVDNVYVGAIDSYTFTALNADHTIDAVFAINTYTITSTANTGVEIAPLAGDTVVDYGTTLTYTFTVDSCHTIADVIVDGESIGAVATYTFTAIDADHTISVISNINTYEIVATVNGVGGTITPAGTTLVACTGSQNYTIVASNGYYVESVAVDGVNQGAITDYNFSNVTANHTIEVTFAPYDSLEYTIISTAGINGTINPLGTTTVFQGGSQSYVITADPMYVVDSVLVDDVYVGNVTYYNFTNVSENHTIHATFRAATCPAPTNPYESNITETSAVLNWGDVEANSYTVRYRRADETTFTIVPGITTNSYTLNGLEDATTYIWSVKSVCIDDVAESNWTSQRTFVTVDAIDTTGIQDVTIESINVYSYGNNIYVQNNTQEQIKAVQVFDMYGRMVYTGKAQSNPEIISINAATGNYIVRVISDRHVGSYKVNIMKH